MPLEEHMGEVSWESSEKFKESYSQDVSLNRELMTKINKQRDLFCPWAGGVPFLGRRPWSWDTVVLAGLFQDELPSWRHQQEGPSTFAPRRATPRECRRSSSSSRSNTKGRGLQEIKSNLPTGVAGLPMDVQARHCQKNYISSPIEDAAYS
ncbi:uncharacterized protein LOC131409835 isoform X3 [Diceros bicornis minor]|uniref:uncharacterized protein LOC131409835 isoform X3 n=1 Tax=Diceros bicornis minor TaxID=77932 RepID=UPI0026EFE257|nr:uncharacterized protein LOC131409835 isoform X3 [Diceros bicornis minor]